MSKAQVLIKQYLRENGPSCSSLVKDYLCKSGMSSEAAKKAISRKGEGINVFTSISLPKREGFLYLDKQYNSGIFWENLLKTHIEKKSAYGLAISSLIARNGICSEYYFKAYSGSPIYPTQKRLSHDFVIQKLEAAKIIELVMIPDLGRCIRIHRDANTINYPTNKKYASDFTEGIIIDAVSDWLKKTGLASFNAIKKRTLDDVPEFGAYKWDITAPSYILPLRTYKDKSLQPGFVVADVFNGELDEDGIQYFINKCKNMSSLKSTKPFLPILLANRFTKNAYQLGRSEGYLLTTPEILFSDEIAKAFIGLTESMTNMAAIASREPEKMIHVFNSLKKIEGVAHNLKGALFEMLSAHIVHKSEGAYIDIGNKVEDLSGNKAEIDVLAIQGNHSIKVIECKAKNPNTLINKSDIEKWTNDRIPLIYKWIKSQERFDSMEILFEYWTTSDYSEDSKKAISEYKPRKYGSSFRNGKQILDYAKKAKVPSIVDTLNEHFIKHPLSKI